MGHSQRYGKPLKQRGFLPQSGGHSSCYWCQQGQVPRLGRRSIRQALALEPLPPGLGLDVQFVEQLATDQCSGAAEVVPAARFDEIGKGLQVGIALDPQRKEIGAELVAVRAPEARMTTIETKSRRPVCHRNRGKSAVEGGDLQNPGSRREVGPDRRWCRWQRAKASASAPAREISPIGAVGW